MPRVVNSAWVLLYDRRLWVAPEAQAHDLVAALIEAGVPSLDKVDGRRTWG